MSMKTIKAALAACAIAAVGLSGCAMNGGPHMNPYKDVSVGHYFYGDTVPSKAYFEKQDAYVKPHCEDYAESTNPSAGRTGAAYAVNEGVGGFIGGAGGEALSGKILGGPVTTPMILGAGGYYGVAAGAEGYATGLQASDQQVNGWTKSCMIGHVGGYRSVSEKEFEEIQRTGHSQQLENAIAADPVMPAMNGKIPSPPQPPPPPQ